jgi:hypothetical protein
MSKLRSIASDWTAVIVIFVLACATAGTAASSAAHTVPPKIISRAPMPPLNFDYPRPGIELRADIEVQIDSTGTPDMSTFKAFGTAVTGNRDAFYQYVQTSTFEPALRDGHPISGIYRERLGFRFERR